MKKYLLLLIGFGVLNAYAQTKLGLKIAPIITNNRVTNEKQDIKSDGSHLNFSMGLIMDMPLTETYYFSSGIIYIPKQTSIMSADSLKEEYKLQYIQLPIALKLFTNEIKPNLNMFFKVGGSIDIKVFDMPSQPNFTLIEKFNPLEINLIAGIGSESRLDVNTVVFASFTYQRGLTNIVNKTRDSDFSKGLSIRNTVLALNFGVKF